MSDNSIFLNVIDHSISKEQFQLYYDEKLDLVYTFPQPEQSILARYYESDDYISHTDGQRSIFEKAYQFAKNIALRNKTQLVNELHPNKGKMLDIGSGTGDFLQVASKSGWQTIGIEPSKKAKDIAISKGVLFADALSTIEDHSLDVITMWHVLEHIPNIEAQIKELKRLLAPGGTIIIAVPNFNSFDAKYYGSFWAAFDVPRHLWHFSKTSIKILFEREKLQLIKVLPMRFDAFYVALLSEKYKTGKMNIIKAFLIGVTSNWKARRNQEYSSLIYVLKNE